jgi:anti-sigma B factor antagonist
MDGTVTRGAVRSLTMTVEQQVLWVVVRLSGELDRVSQAALDGRLSGLVRAAEQPRICVDLSGLDFCDSSGVACLLRGWQAARERGGALVLLRPGVRLAHKLMVSGLAALLTVIDELPR